MTQALPSAAATGGDFFRYHGWLAPGVRLFRNLGFSAKAWCLSFAFLVPLLVSLSALTLTQQAQVDVARAELRGVDMVRPALQLVQAAQDRRLAASLDGRDLAAQQAPDHFQGALHCATLAADRTLAGLAHALAALGVGQQGLQGAREVFRVGHAQGRALLQQQVGHLLEIEGVRAHHHRDAQGSGLQHVVAADRLQRAGDEGDIGHQEHPQPRHPVAREAHRFRRPTHICVHRAPEDDRARIGDGVGDREQVRALGAGMAELRTLYDYDVVTVAV